MKSSAEMKDLKIISMSEGKQISKVKDIIINAQDGCLAFFIVDQPSDYFGARLVAFQDILGLGDYALIIPDSSVIQDVAHNDLAIKFLQSDVKIVGSQVLTTKGSLIGEVTEMMIDEETGRIASCQVTGPQGDLKQVSCEQVITYGKELILIDENPTSTHNQATEKKEADNKIKAEGDKAALNEKELLKKKIEAFGKSESLLKTAHQDFNVFEQRQLQFLLGKILSKDVALDDGSLLKAGESITAEALSVVKSRNTLMQLTVHVVK